MNFLTLIDLTIKFLTLIAVFIGIWRGLSEYRNAQKWKKAEFLANEFKKFSDDPYVEKTSIMLDGYSICISVNKNDFDGKCDYIDFNKEMLLKALSDSVDNLPRQKEEVYIRLCIDRFLVKISIFQSYYESKLLTRGQLSDYFSYWVKIIAAPDDNSISPEIKESLYRYIHKYRFDRLKRLFENLDYSIPELR